ncbi:MAG: type I glutamate--ammonia ligase, partial [Clostridia bacterium]|nr:type I glutamate--ammonia ligase [Clostridia bacterium]
NACDNYIIFKSVVKAISTRNGLFASFMPKPLMDNYGNGLSLNFDIAKNNTSIFNNEENKELAENFIAGVLNRSLAGTILFNSYPNSFNRIGNFNAPSVIDFSQNVDSFIRLSHKNGRKRLEFKSCDNACNLYLLASYILKAGLEGIKNNEQLKDFKPTKLPTTLNEAIELAAENKFLFDLMGKEMFECYLKTKIGYANEYINAVSKSDLEMRDFLRL